MRFYADLHVHSKYSRATSRDLDLEHLALWGKRKGLTVIATGDFTHPAWWDILRDELIPAEPGLFRLKPEVERAIDAELPVSCRRPVRFLLEVEISTIYKKGEKTRKVHHLIYAANFDTAGRFRDRLGAIGNIASDGRPILGLDSRHLLEITLESGDDAFLIPAHIWTPWFSAMGSKSGFDSIDDCYGDLAEHLFAVETGLSSDPPMNWRVSHLDRFTLVSSSDAHSPGKLGREANVFDTELDYFAMRRALETGDGWGGTVEFFPEEGKYHLDGHRACGVRFEPDDTRRHEGRCPSCGKPLTVGVLHRVEALADRPVDHVPDATPPFRSLVPLPEVVGELRGYGPQSKAVRGVVAALTARLGPELEILEQMPIEDVRRGSDTMVAEAVSRLRAGKVRAEGGFDGEYGTIRVFEPDEIVPQLTLAPLFGDDFVAAPPAAAKPAMPTAPIPQAPHEPDTTPTEAEPDDRPILERLDPDQRRAAEITQGPLLIVAGPGSGKTRTLVHRLAHLVETGVDPATCLAITFTRRAAGELRERLDRLLGDDAARLTVTTFHGLGLDLLRRHRQATDLPAGFRIADDAVRRELVAERFGLSAAEAGRAIRSLGALRRPAGDGVATSAPPGTPSLDAYRAMLAEAGRVDLDDLLCRPTELFDVRPELAEAERRRFAHVAVDEYQDVDAVQYRLLRHLAPAEGNLCAIGDPDQSIYAFRGADVGFFLRFRQDFPGAEVVELARNYRSSATIVDAAAALIRPSSLVPDRSFEPHRRSTTPR
ncbi:MAG: UvrD-helicase domain-containing protein, partial [Acidobacteriota bacterium]